MKQLLTQWIAQWRSFSQVLDGAGFSELMEIDDDNAQRESIDSMEVDIADVQKGAVESMELDNNVFPHELMDSFLNQSQVYSSSLGWSYIDNFDLSVWDHLLPVII